MAVAFCALLCPIAMAAQKKSQSKKIVEEPLKLKNSVDSVSYAFGAMMVKNGIQNYMIQMGVLVDTAAVKVDYQSRIDKALDAKAKERLGKELIVKLDSVEKSNLKNRDEFLNGFAQSMSQEKAKNAFSIGTALGGQFASMSENISKEILGEGNSLNTKAFITAFSSGLKDETLLIDNSEELIQEASEKAKEASELKKSEGLKEQYAEVIATGKAFMAENKAKAGVVTLPSGLQYKVINEGTGPKPTMDSRVKVDYVGTLMNGDKFDSSIDRGEAAVFGVGQVVKGWTEALLLMPVGSKWIVYVPYDLAYGSRDTGGPIKPYSNLIFEIELLGIEE